MKDKVWFQTNLGFIKTKTQFIVKHRDRISGDMKDSRGRLDFRLKGFPDITYQITTKGKIGIFYPEGVRYQDCLERVKPFLVKADGREVDSFVVIKEPDSKQKILEQKVKEAIQTLRFLKMRDPTIIEIAYQVGDIPEKIRELAFKLAPKTKWREPSEEQIKDGELKIHEIHKTASLLRYFKQEIVLNRPVIHLADMTYENILRRTKYAIDHEQEKLPEIVLKEENDKWQKFNFEWASGYKYGYHDMSEYYYKETRTLSGRMGGIKETLKKGFEIFNEYLDRTKDK